MKQFIFSEMLIFGLVYMLGGLARNQLFVGADNCQVGHQGKHCDGNMKFVIIYKLI